MADHSEVAYTTADGNDYPAHEQTYEGFIMLVKYGTGCRRRDRRPDGLLPDLMRRLLHRHGGGGPEKFARRAGCETGIQLSGNNASLLARALPAPPEAP